MWRSWRMDRMRKLIADHMVASKHTSPHVTNFVEVDMTNIVEWRNRIKKRFEEQEGQKITYTPIFIEAVTKAIKEFPGVNVSVDGYNILYKKDINIGMAAALPSGNLIVPVIKNADRMNLVGLTATVNDLASRARQNKAEARRSRAGTFADQWAASAGIMGTPVINQPQVAILAVVPSKRRWCSRNTAGDVIGIRHMMYMSMSYDHRVVDGMMGGSPEPCSPVAGRIRSEQGRGEELLVIIRFGGWLLVLVPIAIRGILQSIVWSRQSFF